ncbi:hypothetical protein BpHYR1_030141 [Brachionus plicatilis]|uniref:Uncharacterized protein n=1 Tax=Brachionus plicatilis TaxID=10195 RepID=A0A3M7RMP5_BRAPC|nr:hypothetical protein BpHYR1_030141 [Brachionus plicatilis]
MENFKLREIPVQSILKLKYDTPSNIIHQEAFNKLDLLTVSNRLFELNERYIRARLSHSVPLVVRLVEEYRDGFESRYIEYSTPFCNCNLSFRSSYLSKIIMRLFQYFIIIGVAYILNQNKDAFINYQISEFIKILGLSNTLCSKN